MATYTLVAVEGVGNLQRSLNLLRRLLGKESGVLHSVGKEVSICESVTRDRVEGVCVCVSVRAQPL